MSRNSAKDFQNHQTVKQLDALEPILKKWIRSRNVKNTACVAFNIGRLIEQLPKTIETESRRLRLEAIFNVTDERPANIPYR